MDVYEVLDNYVGWLIKQNLAPHSIKNYLTSVKRFLRMYDVEVINEKLKDKVDLCIIVPSDSMQQVEDVHLVILHAVFLALR